MQWITWWIRHAWWLLTSSYHCDACGRRVRRWEGKAAVHFDAFGLVRLLCPECENPAESSRLEWPPEGEGAGSPADPSGAGKTR